MNYVDIDEVFKALDERCRINSLDLCGDIVFVRHGKIIPVSMEAKKDFTFTGLNNIDFIRSTWKAT